jgi:hypothetical protein
VRSPACGAMRGLAGCRLRGEIGRRGNRLLGCPTAFTIGTVEEPRVKLMTEDEMRVAFRHFQKQIDFLAIVTGQALGALAYEDPRKRDALDRTLTHWEGQANDLSSERIISRLRSAADKMLAGGRLDYPADDESGLPTEGRG